MNGRCAGDHVTRQEVFPVSEEGFPIREVGAVNAPRGQKTLLAERIYTMIGICPPLIQKTASVGFFLR